MLSMMDKCITVKVGEAKKRKREEFIIFLNRGEYGLCIIGLAVDGRFWAT